MTLLDRIPASRLRTLVFAALGILLVGGALALAPVTAANAHDYIVDSSPKAGSTVTAPVQKVTLTFNDVVLDLGGDGTSSIVQVTDAEGLHYEKACAATQGRNVISPVELGGAGQYTVTYQIVSADGHTVSDSYAFTYSPEAGAQEAKGTAQSVCASATNATAAPATAGADDDALAEREAGSAAMGTVLTVVGIIFALVVAGVLIAIFSVRKKPQAEKKP